MRTLVLLKPDVLQRSIHIGTCIKRFEEEDLVVVALKMVRCPANFWEMFYREHIDRPMFKSLVKFMTTGSVVAMVLDGADDKDVISTARDAVLKIRAASTGCDGPANLVHASDSPAAARHEITYFFSEDEIRRL